jgi:flagellar basal-body rod protein FlgC
MSVNNFFDMMHVSSSGMSAERTRMDVIAKNLANQNTTRTANGGPYRRKTVVFREVLDSMMGPDGSAGKGVTVANVVEDMSPLKMKFEPEHPDADEEGNVYYPNVSPVTEMVNMIAASRAYEANIQALVAARGMINKALEIGK